MIDEAMQCSDQVYNEKRVTNRVKSMTTIFFTFQKNKIRIKTHIQIYNVKIVLR